MADDTVEDARQRLRQAIRHKDNPLALLRDIPDAINALIAAVRAELLPYLRHNDACDAAAWEQRRRTGQVPAYSRPPCTCGLDKLISAR